MLPLCSKLEYSIIILSTPDNNPLFRGYLIPLSKKESQTEPNLGKQSSFPCQTTLTINPN
ncbi:hypothetical protein NSTC745_05693 [Nostoc sp. DSM 114161]|jgi:hypothetical protein